METDTAFLLQMAESGYGAGEQYAHACVIEREPPDFPAAQHQSNALKNI